jgi:hypothetical protein
MLFVVLWIIASKIYNSEPSPSQTSPADSTKAESHAGEVQTQAESKSVPAVKRKLYIDSPDMEEIIEANLRLQAADYGFQLVPVRSQADVVLEGSAGVLKQEGWLGACEPFYGFDVVRQGPTHGKRGSFKLESGIPNDLPCIRLAVAKRILYDLRERLDALDGQSARQ